MNYGYEFECKLLAAVLNDAEFLTQIGDVLQPKHFNSQAGRWLAKVSLDYYRKYRVAPSLLTFKVEVENLDVNVNALLRQEAIAFLGQTVSYVHSPDLPYVKEQTIDMCRQQEMKAAILESVDLLKTGDYERIKSLLDSALKVGLNRGLGHEYKTGVAERYSKDNRSTVGTPWEALNDILDGGIGQGELNVVIAPGGVGKSWVLCALGAAAVQQGLNVIHYTLELNKFYVAKRYDSILVGMPRASLDLHMDKVETIVSRLPGNLVVEEYPMRSVTVSTLEAHIDRYVTVRGKEPDLVIVDYGALLRGSNKNAVKYEEIGDIYQELRGLAKKHSCPVWTAGQTHRDALEKDVITADDIAEAYSIIGTSDCVISLSRKTEDQLAGTGRFHIIKNRNGPSAITLPSRFNDATGKIEMYLANSREAVTARKDMNNGEALLRKELGRRYFDEFLEMTGSATPPV